MAPAKSILRVLRKERGLNLQDMARHLGTSVSRYYKIETGLRPAPPEFVHSIAKKLGVDSSVIFLPQSFTVRTIAHNSESVLDPTGTEGRQAP